MVVRQVSSFLFLVPVIRAYANILKGFHATTSTEFAEGYEKALSLPDQLAVRKRARASAKRFTEEEFVKKWTAEMEKLVAMRS